MIWWNLSLDRFGPPEFVAYIYRNHLIIHYQLLKDMKKFFWKNFIDCHCLKLTNSLGFVRIQKSTFDLI